MHSYIANQEVSQGGKTEKGVGVGRIALAQAHGDGNSEDSAWHVGFM